MLEAVCPQYSQWRGEGLDVPRVAINVSIQQLRDPTFVGTVRRILDRYGMPPSCLELELTEAALIDRREPADGQRAGARWASDSRSTTSAPATQR